MRPEDIAVVGVWIAYAVAVAALTPRYFAVAAGSAHDYLEFGAHSLRYILIDDSPAIGWYVAVAGWWLLTPARRTDAIGALAAAAGAGFLAAVVLQHKGWSYHFYPVNALAFLLAAATSASAWPTLTGDLPTRLGRRVAAGIFSALVVAFAIVVRLGGRGQGSRAAGSAAGTAGGAARRGRATARRALDHGAVLADPGRVSADPRHGVGVASRLLDPVGAAGLLPELCRREPARGLSYAGGDEPRRAGGVRPGRARPRVPAARSPRDRVAVVERAANPVPGRVRFPRLLRAGRAVRPAASAYTPVDDVGGIRLLRDGGAAPAEAR